VDLPAQAGFGSSIDEREFQAEGEVIIELDVDVRNSVLEKRLQETSANAEPVLLIKDARVIRRASDRVIHAAEVADRDALWHCTTPNSVMRSADHEFAVQIPDHGLSGELGEGSIEPCPRRLDAEDSF